MMALETCSIAQESVFGDVDLAGRITYSLRFPSCVGWSAVSHLKPPSAPNFRILRGSVELSRHMVQVKGCPSSCVRLNDTWYLANNDTYEHQQQET